MSQHSDDETWTAADSPVNEPEEGGEDRELETRAGSDRRTFLKGSAVALGAGALSVSAGRASAWDDERERIDRVD
ncbi:twin-arginine translocation signal domain-containing protein, partial [Halococcus hamelinensis]